VNRAPRIGVLALQGDVREHEAALLAGGAEVLHVRTADALERIDALVIPGGESTTMSKLAVRDQLFDPLRQKQQAGMPMYGSCAGMIMLAASVLDARPDQETVGGLDITVRRNAFGRQVDSFEIDLEIEAIGADPFPAVFIRAPWVEATGPEVEVLATVNRSTNGERGAGSIVAVRQGRLLATSFHPELTGDNRIHEHFIEMVRKYA
jgi:pyridoxal 5'-phosphate synthase pdxT subunit